MSTLVRQESWCHPTVRFEAAAGQQARYLSFHRKQHSVRVKPSGKTDQLSCLVSVQSLSLISQQTFVSCATTCRGFCLAHCIACAEIMREFSPVMTFTCQRLTLCLAGNLSLIRVRRNLNSWGCRVVCAIPDGLVTDDHMSIWDARQCSRPQKCKCV